ncbi:hypothetical protein Tco_1329168 [Tanacetum coccineum]
MKSYTCESYTYNADILKSSDVSRAETLATACYTHTAITNHTRHNKNLMCLLLDKKLIFHFSSYWCSGASTNDSKDLGNFKPKLTLGFSLGIAPQQKGIELNRETRRLMENNSRPHSDDDAQDNASFTDGFRPEPIILTLGKTQIRARSISDKELTLKLLQPGTSLSLQHIARKTHKKSLSGQPEGLKDQLILHVVYVEKTDSLWAKAGTKGVMVSWSSKECTAISTTTLNTLSMSGCCAQILVALTAPKDYGLNFNKIHSSLSIENGSLFEGESEFEKLKIYLITLVSIRSDWEDLPWLFRNVENLVSVLGGSLTFKKVIGCLFVDKKGVSVYLMHRIA